MRRRRRLLFDLETTGLLPWLKAHINDPVKSRVHILAIRDLDTSETFVFRQNDQENTIRDGIKMLNEAELLVAHNGIGFDIPVLWLFYGDEFQPTGKIRDTLILCRMYFADEKERDFRRVKRGQLEGKLIGRQGLEAWGQRLGYPKDDYSARMKAKAKELGLTDKNEIDQFVWAKWSQNMEDYCLVDIDVNEVLWNKIEKILWSEEAIVLEHQVAELMERVKENGFPFDIPRARALEANLRQTHDEIAKECIAHFGLWHAPKKWNRVSQGYDPRPEFGEDDRRRMAWGDIIVPLKDTNWKDPVAKGGNKVAGAAYCPIVVSKDEQGKQFIGKVFNPNSRPQIIDRLTTIHNWEPQIFTEAGNPTVDDEVLRDLATTIPICEQLADLFYFKKRLGQLVDGKNGLIGKAEERGDGMIHPTINVGGTVTNRASHSDPNVAQVPRVVVKKVDGVKTIMKGYDGDHGWDFRRLFYAPDGWVLMGADMKGIELRALAHYMFPFDQGEYMNIVVNGDVHSLHQEAMGIESRDVAKTTTYALLYGAQDYKLGCTVKPELSNHPTKARELGARIRSNLSRKLPAFAAVDKAIRREAQHGSVRALDGRELFVRAKHAALNTKLQGCGATLAKKWCVLFEAQMEDEGYIHSWNGDFVILAWIHDELQIAVRDDPKIRAAAKRIMIQSALDAGIHFSFSGPVDVEVKFGDEGHDPDSINTWAATH